MATRASGRRTRLYAAEAPKPWAELREEELERENHPREVLDAWAEAGGLEPGTPVVWLMPKKKAAELAPHHGRDDAEPVAFSPEDVVLVEASREAEPGWVLARVLPKEAPEVLVVEPPVARRAWSMAEALEKAAEVEMLCFYDGEPLTPDIARMKRLRIVELDGAPLSALPEELFGLPALEQLSVVGTALSALPPSFTRLKQLKRLILVQNRLPALPELLGELPRLTELLVDPSVLGEEGAGLEQVARLPALRRLDVVCRAGRPSWLKPFGAFVRSKAPAPLVSFVRAG